MTSVERTAAILAPDLSPHRMREILEDQRTAFLREGPPSAAVRRDRIDRLSLAVLEHADELAEALMADFGNRPLANSISSDILGSLPDIEHVRAHLEEWMQPRIIEGTAERGTPTFVQNRPKGVVGVIGPWNFPVTLVVTPAIEALAAGNRVMLKFSEIPARTAEVFARAVAERLDSEEVAVLRGGPETSAAFSSLPFDHLFFTGSPGVGRHVAAAAGRNLVPVTLELGGKNPVVVAPDADVAVAAERISAARMMNGGQLCLCPDWVFVPRAGLDEFVDAYRASTRRYFPTVLGNPDYVTSVNDANYSRVVGLIDDAAAKGATIVPIAPDEEQGALPDPVTRRIPPTLVLGVTEEMDIAHDEVFGPVISVRPYDTVDETIEAINAKPSPLAAYWYGADTADFQDFLRRTTSGGVTRNDMALHFGIEGTPFGGVGQSGIGAYHGRTGFDALSHQRTVTGSELPIGIAPRSMPPYTPDALDGLRQKVAAAAQATRDRLAAP
ncbi:aldehyde dehydrogenase family protein [Cryptosporangium aurantiacum]|uniref:Aldehyde dehydrogenase n=1 Tax=Cryptosporangium aurantiacum TaxID=134849 RepID=A0A1M7PHF6_9ACTN|nr:aldehyde dehydrogenase family protein [Cryptosporangium aurantiacum]SHN16527.1 coniferyl-aldehyde dehydrogenase [Cryptosporangium aurantiacum]